MGYIGVKNSYEDSFNLSIKKDIKCDWYLVEFRDLNVWLISHKDK